MILNCTKTPYLVKNEDSIRNLIRQIIAVNLNVITYNSLIIVFSSRVHTHGHPHPAFTFKVVLEEESQLIVSVWHQLRDWKVRCCMLQTVQFEKNAV